MVLLALELTDEYSRCYQEVLEPKGLLRREVVKARNASYLLLECDDHLVDDPDDPEERWPGERELKALVQDPIGYRFAEAYQEQRVIEVSITIVRWYVLHLLFGIREVIIRVLGVQAWVSEVCYVRWIVLSA